MQLFVQSAIMNLVTGVEVDAATDPGWRDWSWMKNYRVSEANRKVFCFPESWHAGNQVCVTRDLIYAV